LVGERLEQIDRGLRLPAEHEAGGEQVCGLCILGSALVQLPEVGQRMRVVVLLEIGESKIQKQSRLMRAESKCPLVHLDGARVPVGVRIDYAQIS